jgi:hypothetical protein
MLQCFVCSLIPKVSEKKWATSQSFIWKEITNYRIGTSVCGSQQMYRFLSHNFPRSKTMWFLANSSIWYTKMLFILTILHPTTCLNVFLWQFSSLSSYLEQRTVQNIRGPFFVMFSLWNSRFQKCLIPHLTLMWNLH